MRCPCRPPKRHRDCSYCGSGWAGEVVCGYCREHGIDGPVIRGTSRVRCSVHRNAGTPLFEQPGSDEGAIIPGGTGRRRK